MSVPSTAVEWSRRSGRSRSERRRWVLALSMVLGLAASPAAAAPLDLDLAQFPDVLSGFIDVTYDADTNQLVMAGFARELSTDGVSTPEEIDSGGFDLTAEIDDVGELVSGTLSITGTIASLGFESGTLLTGDLTDFGFPTGGGSILEFTFDVTGGDLEAEYDGRSGGIIAGGTGFGGSFDSDFDNLMMGIGGTGTGSSNTAPIPEPGTLALLSAALGGLAYVGRRRA